MGCEVIPRRTVKEVAVAMPVVSGGGVSIEGMMGDGLVERCLGVGLRTVSAKSGWQESG